MRKLLISTLVSLLWAAPAMAQVAQDPATPPVAQNQATVSNPHQQQSDT